MCKGVVNLYTREYFQLIYDRLAPNGMATYWLPIEELLPREARSIIKGFCNVFKDCSLWASEDDQWMLAGIKEPSVGVSYNDFVRAWDDPKLGIALRDLGFLSPQQFGSLFVADAQRLRDWVSADPVLTDNYLKILGSRYYTVPGIDPQFRKFLDPSGSQQNFMASEQISRIWPQKLREETEHYFASRNWVLKIMSRWKPGEDVPPAIQARYLSDPLLKPFQIFSQGSDPYAERIKAQAKETRQIQ
jgi:hypothetical protein